ncbi:MAG: hypothetical protein JSU87_13445 [Gemmatimonadota bacterium]|nr:MAG: hypothetical protein JSU87_13445 [Gemmatimonadota bacterium]
MIGRLVAVIWIALGANALCAQVPERRLERPDVTFADAFSLVGGLRELSDGRVMVADPLGQVLVIADLEAGSADTIGGVGQGPEEYRQPDAVFPLPGDSTLLVDLGNARLTVIGPDGGFGATMPIAQNGPAGRLLLVLPRAADSEGGVYFQPLGGGPVAQLPDSAPVVRWDRGSGAMDTLARVALPEMKVSTSGGPSDRSVAMRPVPLSYEDAWAVAWDGRVVTARSADYHVEWIHRDGKIVRGQAVSYEPVKLRRADKEEWVESLGNGLRVGIEVQNGERRVSFGRGVGGSTPDIDGFDWPDVKPPFVARGVSVDPEGYVWVQRHVPAGEAVHLDVFDEAGNLKAMIELPTGRGIVGFGRGAIYATRTDELGLQWLERYSRPAI